MRIAERRYPGGRRTGACLAVCLALLGPLTTAHSMPVAAPMASPPSLEPPASPASPAVGSLLEEAGRAFNDQQWAASLEKRERALAMAREQGDRPGEAWALRGCALCLEALRRTPEAIVTWQQAAEAFERVGDGPEQVEALAMAGVLSASTEPGKADSLIAAAIARARAETRRPYAPLFHLVAAGTASYYRGQVSRGQALWRATLALIAERLPAPGVRAALFALLADAAHDLGDMVAAEQYLQQSLALRRTLDPLSMDVPTLLAQWGGLALTRGDLLAAWDYLTRALALFQERNAEPLFIAKVFNNLGLLSRQSGNLAAADWYHRQALAIQRDRAPGSSEVAASLHNLALIANDVGNWDEASSLLQESFSIQERLAPVSSPMALLLNSFGTIAGDLTLARSYYRGALALQWQVAPYSPLTALVLRNLSVTEYGLGRWKEAERLARDAWNLVQVSASTVSGDEARIGAAQQNMTFAVPLIRAQLKRGEVRAAFRTVEESRAQALTALLSERSLDLQSAPPELRDQFRIALSSRTRTEQAVSAASRAVEQAHQVVQGAGRANAGLPTLVQRSALEEALQQYRLAQSDDTQARLKLDEIRAEIQRHQPVARLTPLSADQGAQSLTPGTLYLAFAFGGDETFLFLLRRGTSGKAELQQYTLPLSVMRLRTDVGAYLEKISHKPEKRGGSYVEPPLSEQDAARQAGRRLFRALFPEPVRRAIQQAGRVVISPQDALWLLPFASLVVNEQGAPRYLGLEKPLTLTPSLILFAQARSTRPRLAAGQAPTALVAGNLVFERQGSGTVALLAFPSASAGAVGERGKLRGARGAFAPLPHTGAEARAIASLYGTRPLLGEAGSEAVVRQQISSADVIHLATHGWWNPVRAMSSAVLLTAPDREPGMGETEADGLLQAWEFQNQLRLRAELVVLSACETGKGQILAGEGIVGFTRVLQYAGARSVVASLWQVSEESTREMMVAFHQRLRQGLAKDEALRQAMVSVRAGRRGAWRRPYFWAAFFLTGDRENPVLGSTPSK